MASTSNGIMTNGTTKSKSTTVPWVEKYRPTEFEDIMGNETVIERFKVFAECGNIPNVLLCGPPGVGKTTTIHCLARKLLGPQYKDAVLELNASNERGIDVVRNKIKTFAQRKVTLPPGRTKFVVLDEADEMTEGAQQALRRTMECYSSTTRFLLACNLPDKLIEPIQSRCAVVSLSKPSSGQVKERLKTICEDEGVKYDNEGLDAIVFVADGDMRQAINSLQSAHDGFGLVNADNVFKVCDEPHPLMIKEAIQNCMKNNLDEANQVLSHLWKLGYSAEDIITNIFKVVKTMDMPEYLNLEFIKEIGVTYIRISEGNSSLLQFTSLAARLCKKATKAN